MTPPGSRAEAAPVHFIGAIKRPDATRGRAPGPAERMSLLQYEIRARHVRLESAPATINIELTGRCNFKPACTFCVGKNAPDYEDPDHMCGDQLARLWPVLLRSQRVNDCSYGETLLYPEVDRVIERLSAAGVRFGFTTNGLLLTERRARFLVEHADTVELVVSLNAATRETFWRLHGQNFDRIVNNVARFVSLHRERHADRPLPLFLSFIVMRSNRHEVFDFLRLARRLGIEHVILRHLFDFRSDDFTTENFGSHFAYGEERLLFVEYEAIEREVRAAREFAGLGIQFAWNSTTSFIAQQAEAGVDIPCLFPWKFLCVRPLHDSYAPCVYLKKSIAPPSATAIDEVWNGEVMVGIRTSLARGEIADFCMTYGDACPLVLRRRAQRDRSPDPSVGPRPALVDRVRRRLSLVWARGVRSVRCWRLAHGDRRLTRLLRELDGAEPGRVPGGARAWLDLCVARVSGGREIDDVTFVGRCYERLLKRAPDDLGLRQHVEGLESGRRRADIVEAFLTSTEFWKSSRRSATP